jgi:hypothetical protein
MNQQITTREIAISMIRLVLDRQPPYIPSQDMHDLAREGKIVLDLSKETIDPLVDAMYDYRAFSWRISKTVQYGPAHNPNARDIRHKLASLNR